jgi:hypothetical protein
MERDIRKQRKETIYKQREARKHFMEILAVILLTTVGALFFIGLIWLISNRGSF